jgi:hypothetical protein
MSKVTIYYPLLSVFICLTAFVQVKSALLSQPIIVSICVASLCHFMWCTCLNVTRVTPLCDFTVRPSRDLCCGITFV